VREGALEPVTLGWLVFVVASEGETEDLCFLLTLPPVPHFPIYILSIQICLRS
jgi:hypothetical protein